MYHLVVEARDKSGKPPQQYPLTMRLPVSSTIGVEEVETTQRLHLNREI